VVRKVDGLEYALKKVKISNLNEKERENALNEVRLLASIKHTNVIAYREAIYDEATKCLCIVMEYADDGDVFQLISECKRKKEYLPEDKIWHIAVQALRGLK
jgi:NIMA (never in mitosis gene a)-related kinase 1/4/5